MEDENYETFHLYYTAWHEGEFKSLKELRAALVGDIGEDGLTKALVAFRHKRQDMMLHGAGGMTLYAYEKGRTGKLWDILPTADDLEGFLKDMQRYFPHVVGRKRFCVYDGERTSQLEYFFKLYKIELREVERMA